jgi:transposase InsO family protein
VSKARLVIAAVVLEGRTQTEVAATYGVSQGWISRLVARYRAEGDTAFQGRSRRPKTTPATRTPDTTRTLIIKLRTQLASNGHDAGPDTIAWHLQHHHQITLSRATIYRTLRSAGLTKTEPKKKPKSSYIRFAAEQPNECWQSDMTHYRLANGSSIEIITWLDDHSRMALHVTAHRVVTGRIVTATFLQTTEKWGFPASTLTDNGLIYTTRFSGGKGGRNSFEKTLNQHGIQQKNSRPNHPTTCGKVERFQQTLKNWLDHQPAATTITHLQNQIDTFTYEYNTQRPHRSHPHHATPHTIYTARPKATPTRQPANHHRVRTDIIDEAGKVTLRYNSHLYKIGIGRTHARTPILLLVEDLDIRIINAATGELLRHLQLDTTRKYQPTGKPQGGPSRPYGPRKK